MSSNYWTNRARLSRRNLLGAGVAAGAGLAGLALVGCGDDSSGTATKAGGPTTTGATGTPQAAQPKPGGVALLVGTPAVFDTFDTNRSNFRPTSPSSRIRMIASSTGAPSSAAPSSPVGWPRNGSSRTSPRSH